MKYIIYGIQLEPRMIRKREKEQRSIRFPIDLFEKINALSEKEDCSFTEVVISILQEYFDNEKSLPLNKLPKLTKERVNKLTNTPCHLCQNYGLMKMQIDEEGYAYAEKTCKEGYELFPIDDCIKFKRRKIHGI